MHRHGEARNGGQRSSRWLNLWFVFKSQVWLVPAIISILFGMLAIVVMWFGPILDTDTEPPWWLFSGDARTARDLLGTILSGLITMTSLVLSMTFVVLTLAANQLGPRLVAILTNDRQIQSALGLFVGSITYVLIVLRSINDELGRNAVPHLSVTVASALVLVCLMVLLFYVHKIARSIVADTVVETVSSDLKKSLNHAMVDQEGREPIRRPELTGGADEWIGLGKSGYIQTVDYESLVDIACECDGLLNLAVRPGHFVLKHGPHVRFRTRAKIDDETIDRIRAQFQIGAERSPAQDLEYSVRHLVESAARALSPGTKDPFTVVAVIDKLSQSLELLTGDKDLPPPDMVDDDGVLRVRASVTRFGDLVDTGFDQIRMDAAGDAFILARVADAIANLIAASRRRGAADILRQQLDKLESTVKASIVTPADRQECLARIEFARKKQPQDAIRFEEIG